MEIQEDKRALRRGQLGRKRNRGERKGIYFHRSPKGLKEFVNQRGKRKRHNPAEVAHPQEAQ